MAIPPIMPLKPVSKPKPPGKTQQANAPEFAKQQFDAKEKDFMDASVKAHTEDTKVTLLSEHGYFKVFDFDLAKKNTVKQKTVFFVNKIEKTVVATWGHICLNWLSILPDRSKIVDFPISNERPQKKNKKDRISRFSKYTLRWDHGSFKVTQEPYLEFNPDKEDKLILFNEEYELDNKDVIIKNWKSVLTEKGYTKYRSSREFRPTGTPSQILLHETGDRNNMPVTGARLEDGTFLIPHFCIHKIDPKTQKGTIVQFTDVAERLSHGRQVNDRSVGIEFVNPPIEATGDDGNPVFNLTQAKDGIYLKTVISGKPFNRLFIPLEFSADNKSKNYFELKIPSGSLINATSLKQLKIDNINIATEKDKVITIKYCKSERFEYLASLLRLLCSKDIIDIDLTSFDTWKVNIKEKDQELFVFNKAFRKIKDVGDVYWLDVRKKGIYCHGFAGDHSDGHMQALYCFIKFYQKIDKHEDALKKVIDYLLNGKLTRIKRKPVVLYKDKTLSDYKGDKEWEIDNCIIM